MTQDKGNTVVTSPQPNLPHSSLNSSLNALKLNEIIVSDCTKSNITVMESQTVHNKRGIIVKESVTSVVVVPITTVRMAGVTHSYSDGAHNFPLLDFPPARQLMDRKYIFFCH